MRVRNCIAGLVVALAGGVTPAAVSAQDAALLTAEQLRPPAELLLDCNEAPSAAVTQLPEALAKWATVYCTKFGHILSYRDGFFGTVPGTKRRATINAARIAGVPGQIGHKVHFTAIRYSRVDRASQAKIISGNPGFSLPMSRSQKLYFLSLRVNTGHSLSLLVIEPSSDPFWVFPVRNHKIGQPGFFIASLEHINKAKKN